MTAERPAGGTPPDPFADAAAVVRTMVAMSKVRGRVGHVRTVKADPAKIVARVRFDDTDAYLKAFLRPDGPARVGAAQAELATAARILGPGPNRVVRCLFPARRVGFLILSVAPGRPLDAWVRSPKATAVEDTVAMAGRWLAAYCQPRRERRRFDAARFMSAREAALDRLRQPDLRRTNVVAGALAAQVEYAARALEGCDIDIAASHGDFVGRNLHRHGSRIHGFDIDRLHPMALAEDVAQFLVHFQTSTPLVEDTTCGINSAAWQAMRGSGVLPDDAWATTMPLYVALQIERRLPPATLHPARLAKLERMARSLLAEGVARPCR